MHYHQQDGAVLLWSSINRILFWADGLEEMEQHHGFHAFLILILFFFIYIKDHASADIEELKASIKDAVCTDT